MKKIDLPWRCDGCAVDEPETTYSIPPLTPLLGGMLSTGFYGLCATCRGILEREGSGRRGALLIGRRMIDGHARLSCFTGDRRKLVVAELTRFLERILPLLTNPRPARRDEDPLAATAVVVNDAQEIDVWCPSCGRPMKKGETCHGHAF